MRGNQMKTLVSDGLPIEMIESETDWVGGGAPSGDPGNAYGGGHGWGLGGDIDGPGQGRGKGWDQNNGNGRF